MRDFLGLIVTSVQPFSRHFGWRSGTWVLVVSGLFFALPKATRAERAERFGVVDLHVDLPYQVGYKGRPVGRGKGRYVADWLGAAGVDAVAFPLYIPHEVSPRGPRPSDLESSYRRMTRLLPQTRTYRDGGCGRSGVGVFWALEGAAPLGEDLDSVWRWGRRGLALVGLVHSHDNSLASSSRYGYRARQVGWGLTSLGVEVVRRIHAIGGLIDVSHASDAAFDDIIELSIAEDVPAVATHSNARALAPHTRNLSDPQLRAIASTGGLVGVNFHSPFLIGGAGTATLADVVRHIRHIIRIAGINHVGIGSDFEGGIRPPPELADIRGFPKLAHALRRAGYSVSEVKKVMGGNARRLLCRSTYKNASR